MTSHDPPQVVRNLPAARRAQLKLLDGDTHFIFDTWDRRTACGYARPVYDTTGLADCVTCERCLAVVAELRARYRDIITTSRRGP